MDIPSRILITGSSGFVGSYLVPACQLRYPDAQLFGIADKPSGSGGTSDGARIETWVANICEPGQMRDAIVRTQPDLIIHLAAQSSVSASWTDPERTLVVNAGGTIHLMEAVRAAGLSARIILIGSGEQYGLIEPEDNPISEDCPFRPANPYAVSKAAQDLYGFQYFQAYGLPIMRARPFNHFGPRQSASFVVANFARQIALIERGKAKPVLKVGNLQARRDFLPVEDVVTAYLAIADCGRPGAAYNVGSGHARAIGDILTFMLSLARTPIEIQEDPERMRPIDIPLLVADTSRLRADTGWAPAAVFEEAIARTMEYWRAVPEP